MSLEVDGMPTGVPVQAGIKAGQERMQETELRWESSTDYIYAYRVKEFIYSVRRLRSKVWRLQRLCTIMPCNFYIAS